jgi:lipoprotein-anchoring transpeptidase ErfK/SrfK
MMSRLKYIAIGAALLLPGCTRTEDAQNGTAGRSAQPGDAVLLWRSEPQVAVSLDEARYDESWRGAPTVDSVLGAAYDSTAPRVLPLPDSAFNSTETWTDIGKPAGTAPRRAAGSGTPRPPVLSLPLGGKMAGLSVLQAQVLLDRAHFSPGVIDGHWGGNVERAVFWLQRQERIPATGQLDSVTLRRLWEIAGRPAELVGRRVLSRDDVAGPFVQLPKDVYEQEELDCLCYQSLREKLAELAHTTPEVLELLNPGVNLNALAAGDTLVTPQAGDFAAAAAPAGRRGSAGARHPARAEPTRAESARSLTTDSQAMADPLRVARIIVSDRGRYLHALDAAGRIVFHFPATLGSDYFPSPSGDYRVTSVTEDPWFHYQPELLEGKDPSMPTARLAPGPNSPVGRVWIGLSKEHFGIHGTAAPETIGYVTSSGCVRLTNWDALRLARSVRPGVVVEFRDVERTAQPM